MNSIQGSTLYVCTGWVLYVWVMRKCVSSQGFVAILTLNIAVAIDI